MTELSEAYKLALIKGINLKMHLQVLTKVFNDSVVSKLEM